MRKVVFLLIMVSVVFSTCQDEEWKNHYGKSEKSVDSQLWDTLKAIEKYSNFVEYLEYFKLDTIVKSTNTKTLFVPKDFDLFLQGDTTDLRETMEYHISLTHFMLSSFGGERNLKTLSEKYVPISHVGNAYTFDGIEITHSSNLYADGRFYEIARVAVPDPNLYQFLKRFNPAISQYIDLQDTVFLDRAESEPIGFNDQNQTVYDSVTILQNLYELEYFPISEEFRSFSATLLLPDKEIYNNALDEMAQNLGEQFSTYQDIPDIWENEVLIPVLLERGTYGRSLDSNDLKRDKLANIKGDSVIQDFEVDPSAKYTCSNGLVYNYKSYIIGDSLYKDNTLQGETLCKSIGFDQFTWKDGVTLEGEKSFQPIKQVIVGFASADTTANVDFTDNFQGEYTLTFKIRNVFPDEFRFEWRSNYRTAGKYSVYVNDEKLKLGLNEYEEYDTYDLRNGFFSVLGYKLYPDEKGFCVMDAWVNNITEFGDVKITIEYLGPGGQTSDNGLIIDYVTLIPQ